MKMPNLKDVNPLGRSVNSTDVLAGAFAGLIVSGLIKRHVIDRFLPNVAFIQQNWAFVGPVLSGGAVAFAASKIGPLKKHAPGLGIGVLAGGLLPAAHAKLAPMVGLADTVAVNLNGLHGLLIEDNPMNGYDALIEETPPALNGMADLAALSMGEDDDYDGLADLVQVSI